MKSLSALTTKRVNVSHPQFLSLVYHDLFSYPLTKSELKIWEVGIGDRPKHEVFCLGDFFYLAGRKETVLRRIANSQEAPRKLKIARRAARILSILPTIKLIGVSGSLAMENTKQDDDIDFFIITAGGTLWITRLLSFLVLKFTKLKVRRFGDENVKDKLCLNLWVDEDNVGFSQKGDIYMAHEVSQIKVLFEREGTYKKFIEANKWVGELFPNVSSSMRYSVNSKRGRQKWFHTFFIKPFKLIEGPAYLFQKFYMSGKRTREKIEPGRALFHPATWGSDIQQMFLSRLEVILQGKNKSPSFYSQITD